MLPGYCLVCRHVATVQSMVEAKSVGSSSQASHESDTILVNHCYTLDMFCPS